MPFNFIELLAIARMPIAFAYIPCETSAGGEDLQPVAIGGDILHNPLPQPARQVGKPYN